MSRQVSCLHPPGWGWHSALVAAGDELIPLKHAAKWAVEGSPLPPGGAGEGRGGVSGGNGCYEFDSCLRSSHLRKALFQSSSLYPPVPNSQYLRAFVARGLLENCDAKDMLGYKHSGFSVDAGVCIEAHDRAALERLLRYCARPPFSMERLRKEGSKLVYRCAKQRSEPTSDKRGAKADELHLTPLELIDRIAALVPPPRTHRHRYFGVLAPNSPLRAAVTALAQPAASQPATVETAQPGAGVPGVAAPGNAATPTPEPEARPKRAAHYLWAVLIARIYEAFPLLCPMCGGQMRIIAFITHSAEIRHILNHIGVESAPPHITPARGPPLWEGCDAPVDDGAQGEPDWDLAAQPDEVDQRVNW